MKILIMIPVSTKWMKQLSDCGRLINFASLKLIVSNSVTINFFSTFTCKGKAAINHLFGLPKNFCAKWDRWLGDYKKFHFFPESMACTLSSKLWSVKSSEKILLGRVRKLKFWFQRGMYFGGMGEGERMVVLCSIINNI